MFANLREKKTKTMNNSVEENAMFDLLAPVREEKGDVVNQEAIDVKSKYHSIYL